MSNPLLKKVEQKFTKGGVIGEPWFPIQLEFY